MKICGQEMKVTFSIHGRKKLFSGPEHIANLEKHFSNEATEQENMANLPIVPTEGQWFEVNPQSINQRLFRKKRKDGRQEETRKLILEAFAEVQSNPEKYAGEFKTMIPNKDWESKTVEEFKELAYELGDHIADWVEQSLEWAQRICNGESWEAVCNNPDTANWYRLIVWKNGNARLVGGSRNFNNDYSASDVANYSCNDIDRITLTVPLVVSYDK